jgi:hypothetical protein
MCLRKTADRKTDFKCDACQQEACKNHSTKNVVFQCLNVVKIPYLRVYKPHFFLD